MRIIVNIFPQFATIFRTLVCKNTPHIVKK